MTDQFNNWTTADQKRVTDAIRGGATRRDAMRILMAGGISLAAGGTLLGTATKAAAETPKLGGSIRVAGWSSSTADTLDPATATSATDYHRLGMTYNRLTVLDSSLNPQLDLAESIESDDATTWIIKLKSDVTFHDGKALNSADVVYSLTRHLNPDVGSKVEALARPMIEITSVDDLTVRIVLETPNADLPVTLGEVHFMIVADGTTDFSKGNGTGPFMIKEFEPGVRSVSVKNPNYFKPGLPYLDEIEFFAIPDATARVNALLSGDIHVAGSVSPQAANQIGAMDGYEVLSSSAGNYTNLNMRLDMAPGNNRDFVNGMKYLMNREHVQQGVVSGYGEIANDQPVAPLSKFYNADLPAKPYDPDKAKFLFKKAGVLDETIPIVTSEAARYGVEIATLLQQAGSTIGMNFDVQRKPSDGYWSNYWLKAPIHFSNISPRQSPDLVFSVFYKSDAPWNESRFQNAQFDQMLLQARGELDFARRKTLYDDMQVLASEESGVLIPAYLAQIDAHVSTLKGVEVSSYGSMINGVYAEKAWLDA